MSIFSQNQKTEQKGEMVANASKKTAKTVNTAWRVLKAPYISEKASILSGVNQYIFEIFPKVNKFEIKKAVENLYNVVVEKVRIINLPGKKRRLGKTEGFKAGKRKAIVALKKGDVIEIMPH